MLARVGPETELRPVSAGSTQVERLLADLNPPQREAVTHGEGPLLVLAGAGSGKTRVLTHRIAYLLATGRALPSEVLAITFTNKAAGEMRERVERLVGGVSRVMWVMTFHSACARILRTDAPRLGYKRAFTIYDEADSLRMVKRCAEELGVDPKRYPPRAVRAQISRAKNQLLDAEAYSAHPGPGDAEVAVEEVDARTDFEQTVAEVYGLYERRMLEANAMDFDDLLVRTVNLLELFEDVRERYRRAFRWVLVDEYQDTNRAQYRLLQLLVGGARQPVRGRRRLPVDLLVQERRHPQHPRVRARLRRHDRRQARAELPLHPDDPRRGQRDHLPQPRPEAEAPVDRRGPGRPGRPRRVRRRARRGALRRVRDRAAIRRGGSGARRDRGLLPGQRAEPGAGGHAGPIRDPLPGHRGDQVL